MANKALFSAALALGALASGVQAVKYEQFVPRNSSNCTVLPITQDIGRGVFNVSTFFVFLNGTEEINPEELARNNASVRHPTHPTVSPARARPVLRLFWRGAAHRCARRAAPCVHITAPPPPRDAGPCAQEILGECSLLAVTQSIPLTPMQFARLYEDTQSALRQLDNTTFSALSNASTTLDTPPQCSAMLDAIDPAQSYFVRELEKIIGPEQTRAATTNGTADFIAEVRDTGSKTTTVAALGGNPVQYTVRLHSLRLRWGPTGCAELCQSMLRCRVFDRRLCNRLLREAPSRRSLQCCWPAVAETVRPIGTTCPPNSPASSRPAVVRERHMG